jgi:membrane-associated phospholipid phosphatase
LGLSGAVFIAAAIIPRYLRRRRDQLAESRCFAGLRWAAVVAAFLLLAMQVQDRGWLTTADGPTLEWFVRHRSPPWTSIAQVITDIGSPTGVSLLAIAIGAVLVWRLRSSRLALILLIVLLFASGLSTFCKVAVARMRPPTQLALVPAEGLAFPSGHTVWTTAFTGALLLIYLRVATSTVARVLAIAFAICWVLAVGTSRMYLGVHWLTDVAGGVLLGAAVVLAVAVFIPTDQRRSSAKPIPPERIPEQTTARS